MLPPTTSDIAPASELASENDEALDSLGIVVGEIAHDFNNILSLIFGYVEMALSELPEGERARSDLEHVLAAGDRASELVARILTYSKSTKLDREPISLEQPIAELLESLNTRLPAKIKLTSQLESDSSQFVSANKAELYRIVRNLCANSIEAMPENGGTVNVGLDYLSADSEFVNSHAGLSQGDYARITIQDNGCGMDIDTIEKMYTPFFTTTRGGSNGKNQAGLGLTTVFNIVTSYEGYIFVDSAPEVGSKFEICLPILESVVRESVKKAPEVIKNSNVKQVLLIDDEATILTMAKKMIEINGHKVTSFTDGNTALEYFRQQPHKFDIVITDLIMPTISGTELASKLSAINPNVPIVLSTGFSQKISIEACEQWGISTVINKPFTIKELLATVENTLS